MSAKPLKGLTIVFTGRMTQTRFEMEQDAHRMGAYTEPRVTSRTDFLVTGSAVGKTKIKAAERNRTTIITEDEYRQEIESRLAGEQATDTPEPTEARAQPSVPNWAREVRTARTIDF